MFLYEPTRWQDIRLMDQLPFTIKCWTYMVFGSALQISGGFFFLSFKPLGKFIRWVKLFLVIFQICGQLNQSEGEY